MAQGRSPEITLMGQPSPMQSPCPAPPTFGREGDRARDRAVRWDQTARQTPTYNGGRRGTPGSPPYPRWPTRGPAGKDDRIRRMIALSSSTGSQTHFDQMTSSPHLTHHMHPNGVIWTGHPDPTVPHATPLPDPTRVESYFGCGELGCRGTHGQDCGGVRRRGEDPGEWACLNGKGREVEGT